MWVLWVIEQPTNNSLASLLLSASKSRQSWDFYMRQNEIFGKDSGWLLLFALASDSGSLPATLCPFIVDIFLL